MAAEVADEDKWLYGDNLEEGKRSIMSIILRCFYCALLCVEWKLSATDKEIQEVKANGR